LYTYVGDERLTITSDLIKDRLEKKSSLKLSSIHHSVGICVSLDSAELLEINDNVFYHA